MCKDNYGARESFNSTQRRKKQLQKMFGATPNYLNHLHIVGEISIVKTPMQEEHKSKIENKGKEDFFVRYSNDHAGDVYRFYNLVSKQIKISRDVQ